MALIRLDVGIQANKIWEALDWEALIRLDVGI